MKPDLMGATFAERKAAADGRTTFVPLAELTNTTFAQRSGNEKAVQEAENKAIRTADLKAKRRAKD